MERENRIIGPINKDIIPATPENHASDVKFNPANFRYHPGMTAAEAKTVIDYERVRFFRDWGNV